MIKFDRNTLPEKYMIAILINYLTEKGLFDFDDFLKYLDKNIEEINAKYEGKTLFDIMMA
ncbi:hypothetical protein JK635_02530 [Neobacillus sp. YIM B02564]|uniref:Uncharacterized protein n=1 Tax=Neobacillus paridis TaxID=2803862 RepID=A0ABS1TIM3_9BACI|nr:hypothetical protein [Neobacillus paridis]MBL4951117.1 hypothetical protein [Neobacillus paridis]